MGKNLRGGYKLIPLPIDLDTYEGQDAVVSGIYSKIKSTKKRIVLTALIVAGVLMGDLSVEVELKSNGKLFISNAYGYDLTIDNDDKVSVVSHVDASVVANPTLAGTEDDLSGLEVNGTKYKVPSGINVVANPTLAGTEDDLSGLEVGSTKYKVPSSKLYLHTLTFTGVPASVLKIINNDSTPITASSKIADVYDKALKIVRGGAIIVYMITSGPTDLITVVPTGGFGYTFMYLGQSSDENTIFTVDMSGVTGVTDTVTEL